MESRAAAIVIGSLAAAGVCAQETKPAPQALPSSRARSHARTSAVVGFVAKQVSWPALRGDRPAHAAAKPRRQAR